MKKWQVILYQSIQAHSFAIENRFPSLAFQLSCFQVIKWCLSLLLSAWSGNKPCLWHNRDKFQIWLVTPILVRPIKLNFKIPPDFFFLTWRLLNIKNVKRGLKGAFRIPFSAYVIYNTYHSFACCTIYY